MQEREPSNELVIWVIFERPLDFPNHFVVRRQIPTAAGVKNDPEVFLAADLASARRVIPPDLYRQPAAEGDPPHLVEVWF